MEEMRLRGSRLEMVDSSLLTEIKGGNAGIGKLVYRAYQIARAAYKYLPSFWKGFKEGWN